MFATVACPGETLTPDCCPDPKPTALPCRLYVPGVRFAIEYAPLPSVIAVATELLPSRAVTAAPTIGVVPSDCVTIPLIVPVTADPTLNGIALLGWPPTVTTTGAVTAPAGTDATIVLWDHCDGTAAVVPKDTVEFPWTD